MKKDLKCPVCGKVKDNPYFGLCKDCTPYLYKKQGLPHQKARRRKKWIENRTRIIEEVGNKCQWCGSEKPPFSIHHPNGIGARDYDHIWSTIVSNLIKNLIDKDNNLASLYNFRVKSEQKRALVKTLKIQKQKAHNSKIKVCPYCGSSQYNERKTLTPRYRCSSCKKNFDDFKKRVPNNLARSIESLKAKIKLQNYSYTSVSQSRILGPIYSFIYDEARSIYDETVQKLVSEYEEMQGVSVLCKKCHSAVRLGLVICKKCKTNYHRTENKICYQCKTGEKWEDRRRKIEAARDNWYEGDWEELEYDYEDEVFQDEKKK